MTRVFVNGFDFETSQDDIAQHLSAVGAVSQVEMVGRGAAVVHFDNPADAKRAVQEMDGSTIPGNRRYVNVRFDGEKGGKKGGKGRGKDFDDEGKGGRGFEDRTTFHGEFQTGTVAKFLTDRGFGYITPDEGKGGGGKGDIFVHFSAIRSNGFRQLEEGQRVEFGVEPDPKGKSKGSVRAVAVSVI